jgi:integrase
VHHYKARDAASIKDLTFDGLRHTFASVLLARWHVFVLDHRFLGTATAVLHFNRTSHSPRRPAGGIAPVLE